MSAYDQVVYKLAPALYLADVPGRYAPQVGAALPNGDIAPTFRLGDYLEIEHRPGLSLTLDGLTVSAWIRTDQRTWGEFEDSEGSGYVHWMGKGSAGEGHEWAMRMYNRDNAENRPCRISGYVFGVDGGKGSGAYFQDPEATVLGEWLHVAMRVAGATVQIYRDGQLRKAFPIDPALDLRPGTAPLRIGTRDLLSSFEGAIGKVAVWPRALSQGDIAALHGAMVAP